MIGSLIQAGPILDDLPPFSKGINGRDLEMLHTIKTLSISVYISVVVVSNSLNNNNHSGSRLTKKGNRVK